MTREQFHHVIAAAAAVLNVDELLVVGSQAVLASTVVDIPESRMSIEADIAVLGDEQVPHSWLWTIEAATLMSTPGSLVRVRARAATSWP